MLVFFVVFCYFLLFFVAHAVLSILVLCSFFFVNVFSLVCAFKQNAFLWFTLLCVSVVLLCMHSNETLFWSHSPIFFSYTLPGSMFSLVRLPLLRMSGYLSDGLVQWRRGRRDQDRHLLPQDSVGDTHYLRGKHP